MVQKRSGSKIVEMKKIFMGPNLHGKSLSPFKKKNFEKRVW